MATKIKKTKNYNLFNFNNLNRKIDERHLSQLKEAIVKNNLLHLRPIQINSKLQILDGQHRLRAAKDLGVYIYYTVEREMTEEEMILLNQHNKNWVAPDFLEYYAKKGIEDYVICKAFQEKWNFDLGSCIALLTQESRSYHAFRKGLFKIKDLERANYLAERVYSFKPYYSGFRRRNFIFAIVRISNEKKYSHKRMIQKLAKQQHKLVDCTTKLKYIQLLESIYNFRSKDKLRFIEWY